MLGEIVQVVIALLLVLAMFVLGFSIYNMELVRSIQNANKQKKSVMVFSGVKDLYGSKDSFFDTSNASMGNYREIPVSVNQRGGAEFTYNFWVWKDNALGATADYTDTKSGVQVVDSGLTTKDYILFMKGSKTATNFKNICKVDTNTTATAEYKKDVLVKCPLVKFEEGLDVLTVEFNTVQAPDAVQESAEDMCSNQTLSWSQMKGHKLSIKGFHDEAYNQKWTMVTVVIQDTFPTDPLPGRNKVRCRIYVNGVLTLDHYTDTSIKNPVGYSVLKQNVGNLFIMPSVAITSTTTSAQPSALEQLLMADLEYVNYALTADEIKGRYANKFSRTSANNDIDVTKTQFSNYSPAYNSKIKGSVDLLTSF
jgi:hypothetical protein